MNFLQSKKPWVNPFAPIRQLADDLVLSCFFVVITSLFYPGPKFFTGFSILQDRRQRKGSKEFNVTPVIRFSDFASVLKDDLKNELRYRFVE